MTPAYWTKATTQLSKQCPVMKGLIRQYKGEYLRARADGFYTLVRAVVGQQISVKAADAIWNRLVAKVKPLTPEKLGRTRIDTLRALGLSAQKAAYARNVAKFFAENRVTADYWAARSDAEVIQELTSIKGIGSWTAEMFLIFHLTRPDVFPIKDLAVLKAIDTHYTGGKRLTNKEYLAMAERWAPYRSVATWYLWRALDPVPVEY